MSAQIFEAVLGLMPPWFIADLEFDEAAYVTTRTGTCPANSSARSDAKEPAVSLPAARIGNEVVISTRAPGVFTVWRLSHCVRLSLLSSRGTVCSIPTCTD